MREIEADFGRKIHIYDDLFSLSFRSAAYQFAENSTFRIGWPDGCINEKMQYRFLHSQYSHEDVYNLGILNEFKNTPIEEEIYGHTLVKTYLNLSTPSDVNFQHSHPENKVVLFYVNLEWQDGWHGETLFYKDNLKEILLATPYTPGRVTVFDGRIPHAIRPQSYLAPFYRYTLAMIYNKD